MLFSTLPKRCVSDLQQTKIKQQHYFESKSQQTKLNQFTIQILQPHRQQRQENSWNIEQDTFHAKRTQQKEKKHLKKTELNIENHIKQNKTIQNKRNIFDQEKKTHINQKLYPANPSHKKQKNTEA